MSEQSGHQILLGIQEAAAMTVERDDYGDFHVRGTYDDGEPGWGIKVWLKGSDQMDPQTVNTAC